MTQPCSIELLKLANENNITQENNIAKENNVSNENNIASCVQSLREPECSQAMLPSAGL